MVNGYYWARLQMQMDCMHLKTVTATQMFSKTDGCGLVFRDELPGLRQSDAGSAAREDGALPDEVTRGNQLHIET